MEAADSIWAAQKKMAAKVNAAESSGGPLLPNPDAITTKPGKGHQGPHHKKWFRGREHVVDDADVVAENTLERVLDGKTEAGTDDTVSMGDEPIDRDGTDGLPIEARQAIEVEGGEGDLGSGVSLSSPSLLSPTPGCASVCYLCFHSCVTIPLLPTRCFLLYHTAPLNAGTGVLLSFPPLPGPLSVSPCVCTSLSLLPLPPHTHAHPTLHIDNPIYALLKPILLVDWLTGSP